MAKSDNKDVQAANQKVNYIDSLEEAVTALVLCPANGQKPWHPSCVWGQPGLIWGPPGIGKSKRIEYAGLCLSMRTETVYAATRQPEDVSGAAFPDGNGSIKIASLLPGVRRLIEDGAGILFLDELSCARPAVQAAFLGVPLERRIGEDRLPPGVRVLAAANPPHEAAGGWDMEPPMANRFVHLYMSSPSGEEWTDWLLNEKDPVLQNIEDGEQTIRNGWGDAWARSKGLFAGFHKHTGGTKLFDLPKEGHENRGRAWASPRTWEMAARLHATCSILGKPNLTSVMLHGCIGRGIATELETWLADADLPSFEDVISGKWKPSPKRLDKVVAAYTATTAHILSGRDKTKQGEYAVEYWKVLKTGVDIGVSDVVKNSAKALVANGLGRRHSPAMASVATPVLAQLAKDGFGDFV